MPRYTFINPQSKKVYNLDCTYNEMLHFKEQNPTFIQEFTLHTGDAFRLGVGKYDALPNQEFQKNVIQRIKDNHKHHNIDDTGFKTTREI